MIDGVEFTQGISTHAPLARCDIPRSMVEARWKVFQLTHLLRGATLTPPTLCLISCDFNSRTSCEVRLVAPIALVFIPISTHAPLARCDRHQLIVLWHTVFQLTHLLRGATSPRRRRMRRGSNFNSRTSCEVRPGRAAVRKLVQLHFNSRTSCEVRRLAKGLTQNQLAISTHAPLARCDGRTHLRVRYLEISTHAPLARCDDEGRAELSADRHFNSRTSCEVRRDALLYGDWASFISTHAPLARCDNIRPREVGDKEISTHAPLARCDHRQMVHPEKPVISTHAPLARCDGVCESICGRIEISTHAPLARCDKSKIERIAEQEDFNSRTSCEVRLVRHRQFAFAQEFQLTHLLRGATEIAKYKNEWRIYFNSRTSCEVRHIYCVGVAEY